MNQVAHFPNIGGYIGELVLCCFVSLCFVVFIARGAPLLVAACCVLPPVPCLPSPMDDRGCDRTPTEATGLKTMPTTAKGRGEAPTTVTAIERETTAIERETEAIERETAAIERETAAIERRTAVTERKTAATSSDR